MLINLFGSPGCGKSTLALHLTSCLKQRGLDAEYVGEYIKNLISYHGSEHHPIYNQLDILTNQNRLLNSFYENSSFVITDGALLNTNIYIEFNKNPQIEFCKEEIKSLCSVLDSSYEQQFNILVHPCNCRSFYKDSLRNYNWEESLNLFSKFRELKNYDFEIEGYFESGTDVELLCDLIVEKYHSPLP